MASRAASTVADYLASLPADRRVAIARVREVVNARLPRGFEEAMQYGMISWIVPAARLAETYNGQPLALASLASQKQYMALYLLAVYGEPALARWFKAAYEATGKRLDMGKSCVRFKTLDALPLDVIGEAIAKVSVDDHVARYEASRSRTVKPRPVAGAARSARSNGSARSTQRPKEPKPRSSAKRPRMPARSTARSSRR